LNLREEWFREIGGLGYPISEEIAFSELTTNLKDYSAVRLFVESARRTSPDYSLSERDGKAVVHICRLVEGMPLSLELASSWVSLMPCAEIGQEIKRNLSFLSTSLSNIPDRHRSVRALFEHSYQLLSEEERRVVRQLSVFQGDFERQAAEQVAGATLPLLVGLVNKSMLRGNPSGRYDQHELLRQYMLEKLQ
jgi:predicted ATPase